MQQKIKAVFLDIDGTLISYKTHSIHPEDMAALRQAQENGVKLFIASGRDLNSVSEGKAIDPVRPVMDGYVSSNGQQSFLSDMSLIAQHPLDREDVLTVVRISAERGYGFLYEEDHRMYVSQMTKLVTDFSTLLQVEPPIEKALPDPLPPIYKGCVYITPEDEAKYLSPYLKHTRVAHSRGDIIDLIPEGIGKETGIEDLGRYFGFTAEESMAIGDADNDLSILRAAGIGVAMGNAMDVVKETADWVTADVEHAGIACAFRHFELI